MAVKVKKLVVEESVEDTTEVVVEEPKRLFIEETFGNGDLNKLRDAINKLAEAVWR